ncbi:MAG: triose-phosphate isomerase [Syntrophales bacterium LBB04]|nr:triose-phosphate isomerase [Syntrophales bacterium LBB04]
MAEKIIAANWKMHKTIGQAVEFARGLKEALLKKPAAATIVIAPPFTSVGALAAEFKGSNIFLAAQNMYPASPGAFTGEISAEMLVDAGCQYCIVGHSERRRLFGEDNALINAKITAALNYGLGPIFCVGETLAEREAGTTLIVLSKQLKEGLNKVPASAIKKIAIAYEPVWAIGTGKTATPGQVQEAHLFIRNLLSEMYGEKEAAGISIIYGGSVTAANISALMAKQEINGVLVGSASLDLASFLAIVNFH